MSKVFDALFSDIGLAFAVVRALFLADHADKATHVCVEFRSLHADTRVTNLLLSDNSALLGDCLSSDNIVTGDHSNSDTSIFAGCDSVWHLRTDDIIDTKNANKSQIIGLNVLDLSVDWLVVFFTELTGLQVMIGNCDSSQSLFSVVVDDSFDFCNNIVIERSDLA